MYKKVLVATDLLDACDAPVVTAVKLAEQNNAKLLILHALESPYSGIYRQFVKHFKTGEEIVSSTEYVGAVREEFTRACGEALRAYGNYEVKVTPGMPWEQILKWARSEKADLVVLGPHTQRAEEQGVARGRGVFGSTAEAVIMRENYPVMIVNRFVPEDKLKFRKVMVCIAFSKACKAALQFAVLTAKKHGSKLIVFHMIPLPQSQRYSQEELEAEIKTLRVKLQELSGDTSGAIECEWVVREGSSPYVEILKCAREKDVELIAMGSHTKKTEDKWYVGSAVEQVSSRSICPVVVVTKPKAAVHAL